MEGREIEESAITMMEAARSNELIEDRTLMLGRQLETVQKYYRRKANCCLMRRPLRYLSPSKVRGESIFVTDALQPVSVRGERRCSGPRPIRHSLLTDGMQARDKLEERKERDTVQTPVAI
jgi:hypothetical protein